jgi:2-methylaconitate cis-trans-isomerase PrpF
MSLLLATRTPFSIARWPSQCLKQRPNLIASNSIHMARQRVEKSFPASFVRGGTSNGLIIKRSDLPQDEAEWGPILSSAMGSPDSFGRQLNGMGSGISSTSKICVISSSKREDADVDYTFVQVGIKDGSLDMAGNCGNMSSAVGPIAWDEDVIERKGSAEGEVTVRMYNTNTNKIVHSSFNLRDGRFEPLGTYSIDGVPGNGSRITLSFVDPGGAKTGKALPTGNAIDDLELEDGSVIRASLVDVANPGVFVLASDLNLPGDISSDTLCSQSAIMSRLEAIRRAGAKKMGLDPDVQSIPKIVLISKPTAGLEDVNIVCRALSMQQAHKAVPLTLALNLGCSCRIPGTLPAITAVGAEEKESVVIAHASGKVEVGSVMEARKIKSALLHRTARVLMKGDVFYTLDTAK